MTIIITKRENDYHACLKEYPQYWECARSPELAIGKLVISCQGLLNIKLHEN